MFRLILFNALFVSISTYALVRGSSQERIGALILIADFELSHLVIEPMQTRYLGVQWAMLEVDFAAFVALYLLSLFSGRYWPIWMCALQGLVAGSHLAGLMPKVVPWAYGNSVALWSYVLLGMLAMATRRHRARLRLYGVDPPWRSDVSGAYGRGAHAVEARAANQAGRGPVQWP